MVVTAENATATAYLNTSVEFSFYIFTRINYSAYNGEQQDLLLADSGNDDSTHSVVSTEQNAYGIAVSSMVLVSESEHLQVQQTYYYLSATDRFESEFEGEIIVPSYGYPEMIFSRFINGDSDHLNWFSVLTISKEIFLKDHDTYSTLNTIVLIGWALLFAFFHYGAYTRFQSNVKEWETRYVKAQNEEMFGRLSDEVDEVMDTESVGGVSVGNVLGTGVNTTEDDDDFGDHKDDGSGDMLIERAPTLSGTGNRSMVMGKEEVVPLETLDFISANIRQAVRTACEQSWIRKQVRCFVKMLENAEDCVKSLKTL